MRVVDNAGAEGDVAGAGLDRRFGSDDVVLESGRRRDDLECGPGLVQLLDSAVAPGVILDPRKGIGIERRPVRQCEDLATLWLHDDRGAACRMVRFHARSKLAL